jgi:hypothetical protein
MMQKTHEFNGGTMNATEKRQRVDQIKAQILAKLTYAIGKDVIVAKRHDWLAATILTLRDSIIDRWMASTRSAYQAKAKRVYYLSLEFLIGRLLRDALSNLELAEARCGPWQWRLGPSCGLFHGKHGQPRHSRLRLWHPIQSRALSPGHQGWLATRTS